MSQPRRIMPLPLGGEHGLPYSRGLMARALMAVGVPPDRAYTLARRLGDDVAARGSEIVALDLPEEDKRRIFELNARRVYPRLDARLSAAGA